MKNSLILSLFLAFFAIFSAQADDHLYPVVGYENDYRPTDTGGCSPEPWEAYETEAFQGTVRLTMRDPVLVFEHTYREAEQKADDGNLGTVWVLSCTVYPESCNGFTAHLLRPGLKWQGCKNLYGVCYREPLVSAPIEWGHVRFDVPVKNGHLNPIAGSIAVKHEQDSDGKWHEVRAWFGHPGLYPKNPAITARNAVGEPWTVLKVNHEGQHLPLDDADRALISELY
ncbi:MAG: hypothetical protein KC736_04715 [Candidatus Moranbacteria bacterium]|nr:hypothetical protein [Candidatus Moranbacteria bacterium]